MVQRFHGWRQHGSTAPGNGAASATFTEGLVLPSIRPTNVVPKLRSSWDDDDRLASSDGFDFKKWRVEVQAELQVTPRRRAKKTLDPLTTCYGPESYSFGKSAGSVMMNSSALRLPREVVCAAGRVEAMEVAYCQRDPMQGSSICRSGVRSALEERELSAAAHAEKLREHHAEAGRENRRLAAQWREQRTTRNKPIENTKVREASPTVEERPPNQDEGKLKTMDRIRRFKRHSCCVGKFIVAFAAAPGKGERRERSVRLRVRRALAHRVLQRAQQQKQARKLNERMKQLPVETQHFYRCIFNLYAHESSDGDMILDPADLCKCLMEIGLRGASTHEKCAVDRVCREIIPTIARAKDKVGSTQLDSTKARLSDIAEEDAKHCESNGLAVPCTSNSVGAVDLASFCVVVVPAVQQELKDARQDMHFTEFLRLLPPSAVCLSRELFYRLATRLGIDSDLVPRAFEGVESRPAHLVPDPFEHRDVGEDLDEQLNFERVHDLLMGLEQEAERRKRRRDRDIKAATGISEDMFWKYRHELILVFDSFRLYDADHSAYLNHAEVRMMLKHLGLQPYRPKEGALVDALLVDYIVDGEEHVTFPDCLELMVKVRHHQQANRRLMVLEVFRAFDKEAKGRLDIGQVERALNATGLTGKSREEQDLANKHIYECDTDADGQISFVDFQELCQRVVESVFSYVTENNVLFAATLGIDRATLAEYQAAYDQFDRDGSGTLDLDEVKIILGQLMIHPPTAQELTSLYETIGMQVGDAMDFQKYLQLMHVASTGRGMFSREVSFTIRSVHPAKLREILRLFPFSQGYLRDFSDIELAEAVSNCLGIGIDVNMREDIPKPLSNTNELLDHARRIANNKNGVRPRASLRVSNITKGGSRHL